MIHIRVIDADAFDKCLLGAEIEATKSQKYVFSSAINTIRGNLANFPNVNQWISCSERLPDIKEHHVSEPCIVYCENGAYGFAELEENIFGQVGWNCEREDDYHEPLGNVIAWMPLPDLYKGDRE